MHLRSSAANIRLVETNNLAGGAMKDNLLAIAGAVVGGAIGFVLFGWLYNQGFYGPVLPGGLLGIGAGFAKPRSIFIPIACGVGALVLGFVAEGYYRPFIKDPSFGFFVSRLSELDPVTFLLIGLGAAIGFWIPFRWLPQKPKQETSP
jgi:hypothetical protein